MDDSPTVRFESDIDGDLFMFSSDNDVDKWDVLVIGSDGNAERAGETEYFASYFAGVRRLASNERCWCVESSLSAPIAIEIRRKGKPTARTHHPRRSVWDEEFREGSQKRTKALVDESLKGFLRARHLP